MANTTFYNRGDAYHDSTGNPAIIKRGNELTFTEHFNAGGGGGTPYTPPAYSTSKYDTGKKWVDGRPIYGKVFILPALSSTSTPLVVDHNENIDIVTNLHGTAKNATTGTNFPLPYVAEDNIINNIRVAVTSTQLSIANAIDRSMLNASIIIEFIEPTPAPTLTTTRKSKRG